MKPLILQPKTGMKTKLLTLLALHLGLAAVVAQPVITNQPQNQTNFAGATASFTVGATGAPPLSYQWRAYRSTSFTNIPWGSDALLSLTNVQPNFFRFGVVVTDGLGLSVTSSPLVTLTVVTPPTITPANPTASLFADVTLVATNNNAVAPRSYQWLFNGEPIAGAVTNKLGVTNVQKTNAGNYAIVAAYAIGSVTSQVATLSITPFNSMYCFGFSWTDTGGNGCSWPLPDHYGNRACNGPMWPEFLSTNLGLAYVGTNNYAFCGAGPSDILNQVMRFTIPSKPQLSLYCLWANSAEGDDSVLINALTNEVERGRLLQETILINSNSVDHLYLKGAKTILIQLDFHESKAPRWATTLGTNSALLSKYEEYIARFRADFTAVMNAYNQTRPDLRILLVDMFSKFEQLLANPTQYGFTKTATSAIDDPSLRPITFTGAGADYVFWDCCHVTSKLHRLMAAWNLEVVTNSVLEKFEAEFVGGSPIIQMSHLLIGRDYTLQGSSDLANWNDVQTFTASAGTNQVTQPLSAGTASVFYRLQWQH